jgi:sugar diacid utilization regulator
MRIGFVGLLGISGEPKCVSLFATLPPSTLRLATGGPAQAL